jgi:hypothetical protein
MVSWGAILRRCQAIAVGGVLGLSILSAHAQSADEIVRVLTEERGKLAELVADHCMKADEAERQTQIAVGAGFAQSYLYFVAAGDQSGAELIGQIVCTCERTPGDILSSYLASLGELEDQACSTSWQADSSAAVPGLPGFLPSGGSLSAPVPGLPGFLPSRGSLSAQ